MKMKKEHYSTLVRSINEVVQNVGVADVIAHRENVPYAKNQFISFVWSMWRHATDQDFRSELYAYLNDAHVETALKQILKEYE